MGLLSVRAMNYYGHKNDQMCSKRGERQTFWDILNAGYENQLPVMRQMALFISMTNISRKRFGPQGENSISEVGMAIAGDVAQLWNQGISKKHEPHIVRCGWWYNSLRPNDEYMSHRPRSSLVHIIVIILTNGVLLSIRPL